MARNQEVSESEPLLANDDTTTRYLNPGDAVDGRNSIGNEHIEEASDVLKDPEEGPHRDEVDGSRAQQYEGMPEARKQLKYILPAMGIGVSLASAHPDTMYRLTALKSSFFRLRTKPSLPRATARSEVT